MLLYEAHEYTGVLFNPTVEGLLPSPMLSGVLELCNGYICIFYGL
jgi:hypothetical protein